MWQAQNVESARRHGTASHLATTDTSTSTPRRQASSSWLTALDDGAEQVRWTQPGLHDNSHPQCRGGTTSIDNQTSQAPLKTSLALGLQQRDSVFAFPSSRCGTQACEADMNGSTAGKSPWFPVGASAGLASGTAPLAGNLNGCSATEHGQSTSSNDEKLAAAVQYLQLQRVVVTPGTYNTLVSNLVQQRLDVERNADAVLRAVSGAAGMAEGEGDGPRLQSHGAAGLSALGGLETKNYNVSGNAASAGLAGHTVSTRTSSNGLLSSHGTDSGMEIKVFEHNGVDTSHLDRHAAFSSAPSGSTGARSNDFVDYAHTSYGLQAPIPAQTANHTNLPILKRKDPNIQSRRAASAENHEPTSRVSLYELQKFHSGVPNGVRTKLNDRKSSGVIDVAGYNRSTFTDSEEVNGFHGQNGRQASRTPSGLNAWPRSSAPASSPAVNRSSDTRGPFGRSHYSGMPSVPAVNPLQTHDTHHLPQNCESVTTHRNASHTKDTTATATTTQTSGFVPMLAVTRPDMTGRDVTPMPLGSQAVRDLKFSPRYHGMHTDTNASADHLRPEQNCALWITQLPPDVKVTELLSKMRNIGRVYATFINPPNGTSHPKSAAKLVFFTPGGAQNLLAHVWHHPLVIRGHRAQIALNRIKYDAHSTDKGESRVLIITGSKAFVNEGSLTAYFEGRFAFQIDVVQTLIQFQDRAVVEYRFGSYRCQAQMGMKALLLDRPRGLEMVEFGADPCEVGSDTTSFGIAGERIQGRGLCIPVE